MTTNKKISLTLDIIVILIAGITVFVQNSHTQQTSSTGVSVTAIPVSTSGGSTTPTSAGSSTTPTTAPNTYTLADVAEHANAASCWTAINGSVYDVTSWIYEHPGGPDKILGICGKDGSAAFNNQHGGQSRPAAELATFKIGTLAQ